MMLRKVADRLGEPFEETTSSVGEWLRKAEIGLVTTQERKSGRLRRSRQQTMPGGTRPWIWDIPECALYDDPEDGDNGPGPVPAPRPPGPDTDGDTAPGNVGGDRQDDTQQDPAPAAGQHRPGHGEDHMTQDTAPAPAPAWPGLYSYPQLLDMAERDNVPDKEPAQLRRRYCTVTFVAHTAAQPCAGCGDASTVLVGKVPLHLRCPDPPDSWQPPAPASAPARPGPASPDPPRHSHLDTTAGPGPPPPPSHAGGPRPRC